MGSINERVRVGVGVAAVFIDEEGRFLRRPQAVLALALPEHRLRVDAPGADAGTVSNPIDPSTV